MNPAFLIFICAMSSPGFCGLAPLHRQPPSACQSEDMGTWMLQPGQEATIQTCVDLCLPCSRCRYVSFAKSVGICAWYTYCDLGDLRTWWNRGVPGPSTNWSTVQVRNRVPLPLATYRNVPGTKRLSLAIATLAFGGYYCPLGMWCQGANRLKRALQEPWVVEVILPQSRPASLPGISSLLRPPQILSPPQIL
jgi:hypothetical protein